MSLPELFWRLHDGLPRQAPGSDASTRRLLDLAQPWPDAPRMLDIGCGPGRSSLVLAAETGGTLTAVDLHKPFLDGLAAAAAGRHGARIHPVVASMDALPLPDGRFDLVWAEGSAYVMGFDAALGAWRRLLAPGGTLVLTECEWTTSTPSPENRAFWDEEYPAMRSTAANVAAAMDAGWTVAATYLLPDRDWWDEYYTPITERLAALGPRDDPTDRLVIAAEQREIDTRARFGDEYGYMGYVLRPWGGAQHNATPIVGS
jgi:SAM-dependent methyltransferase